MLHSQKQNSTINSLICNNYRKVKDHCLDAGKYRLYFTKINSYGFSQWIELRLSFLDKRTSKNSLKENLIV